MMYDTDTQKQIDQLLADSREPLHDDLAQYLTEVTVLGPYVRHPLVFGPASLPGALNRQLEQKRVLLAEAHASRDWKRVFWLYERPYRMSMLGSFYETGDITLDELRDVLPGVWIDTEFPHSFGALPRTLFTATGFLTDAPSVFAALPETLTIYRGSRAHIRPSAREISWTLARGCAEKFARRLGRRDGAVWRGDVKKSDVLAYFEGRGEAEVVVTPRRITNLHTTTTGDGV